MDVISALREHSEAGAAIVDLLYGDGGAEVSKALIEFGKKEKRDTQKTVAQISNAVGIGAGAAATPGALAAVRPAFREAAGTRGSAIRNASRARGYLRAAKLTRASQGSGLKAGAAKGALKAVKTLRNPKVAAGAALGGAALQVGNLGGDFVTNRVLGRKKQSVAKADDEFEIYTEISKVDTDKRQVFGWASVTKHNGIPVLDLQDDIIDLEEIEKAAYDFVKNSRIGGNMHAKGTSGPVHVSDMIESFVLTPEKKAAMGLPDDTPEGWWVGYKVNDEQTWQDAKSGKLAGFSVHGTGKRVSVDA